MGQHGGKYTLGTHAHSRFDDDSPFLLMVSLFLFNRRRGEVAIDSFDLHVRMTPVVVTAGGN